jgi:hypothetical protein
MTAGCCSCLTHFNQLLFVAYVALTGNKGLRLKSHFFISKNFSLFMDDENKAKSINLIEYNNGSLVSVRPMTPSLA